MYLINYFYLFFNVFDSSKLHVKRRDNVVLAKPTYVFFLKKHFQTDNSLTTLVCWRFDSLVIIMSEVFSLFFFSNKPWGYFLFLIVSRVDIYIYLINYMSVSLCKTENFSARAKRDCFFSHIDYKSLYISSKYQILIK